MRHGILILMFGFVSCQNVSHDSKPGEKEQDWALLQFAKSDEVNPILVPDSTTEFFCPVRNKKLRWEEKDVFNPAAVVRNDTVFLLYRAEDKIGKYAGTSRIGMAWSVDGMHFTKNPVPVLYPNE